MKRSVYAGVAAAVLCLTASPFAFAQGPLSGQVLFADVSTYDSFGVHRTATPGDQATSRWIAQELEGAGYEVKLDRWRLRQFMLDDARLTVGGEAIDCLPTTFLQENFRVPEKNGSEDGAIRDPERSRYGWPNRLLEILGSPHSGRRG